MKLLIFFLVFVTTEIFAMEYLNNGPYKIPALGLGTFTVTDENELTNAVNEALKIGYRHIDTAAAYGNEHIIGKVLDEWISSGKVKREDLFITTKLSVFDEFPDKVESAMKTSLEKLRLDYVDLWLIHFPVASVLVNGVGVIQPTDFLSVWKKMEEQLDAGKTRTLGLSNFNISQIERVQKIARIQPVNLQVETHLFFQQRELRDFAKKHNMTMVAYSPLGAPGLNTFYKQNNISQVELPDIIHNQVVKNIATKHKKSNAQVAIKFLLQSDIVAIPKSTSAKRLQENFEVFDFVLDEDDMKALQALDKGKKGKLFNMSNLAHKLAEHPEYPFYENLPEEA